MSKLINRVTNSKWLKRALVRGFKTFCQTAVSMAGVGAYLNDVNWIAVLSASTLAFMISILTSCAGLPEVNEE